MSSIEIEYHGLAFDVEPTWETGDPSVGIWAGWDCSDIDTCSVRITNVEEALEWELLWGDGIWEEGDYIRVSLLLGFILTQCSESVEERAQEEMSDVTLEEWCFDG